MEYSWMKEQPRAYPIYLNRSITETCEVDPETMIVADEMEQPRWFKHQFRNTFHLDVRIFKKVGKARWKEVTEDESLNLEDINKECERRVEGELVN
jgi:hypothetical protein